MRQLRVAICRWRARLGLDARYRGPRGIDRFGYTNLEIEQCLKRHRRVLRRWAQRYGARWGFGPGDRVDVD